MFRYAKASLLRGQPPVRDGECVALIQEFTDAPHTSLWRAGAHVIDGPYVLMPGTAIATFASGRYPMPGHATRHAAFFLHYGPFGADGKPTGIYIMDQYNHPKTNRIQQRFIEHKGFPPLPNGSYQNASNNADAFYVIERI